MSALLWVIVLTVSAVLFFSHALPVEIVTEEVCNGAGACERHLDAINIAVQLGRLDFVSTSLAILGAAVALFAIFGFLYIKEGSERVAEITADRTARQVAQVYFSVRNRRQEAKKTTSIVDIDLVDISAVERETGSDSE